MRHGPAVVLCLLLAACASAPTAPNAIIGEMPSKPVATDNSGGALVYRSPDLDPAKYHGIFIPAAKVYAGSDAEWGDTDVAARQRVADKLTAEFRRTLRQRGRHVLSAPAPRSVTLELTLGGISATYGAAANVIKLTPAGMAITLIKSAAGAPASFTGSIVIGGRLTDTETGAVLAGFVATVSPVALDPRTLGGTEDTAMLAATKGADDFAAAVDRSLAAAPARTKGTR
jgi:hypothetical protein